MTDTLWCKTLLMMTTRLFDMGVSLDPEETAEHISDGTLLDWLAETLDPYHADPDDLVWYTLTSQHAGKDAWRAAGHQELAEVHERIKYGKQWGVWANGLSMIQACALESYDGLTRS